MSENTVFKSSPDTGGHLKNFALKGKRKGKGNEGVRDNLLYPLGIPYTGKLNKPLFLKKQVKHIS
jgi:hypothetical protein